jgi:hypothetical protein
MMPRRHEGGCLCGQVRFRISEPSLFSSLCHCECCRRAPGAAVAAFVGVPRAQFEELRGSRRIYESSPGVRRGFCPACGTSLSFEGERWPGEIHIYTATLDDPAAFPPTAHTYMIDNIPWFETTDDLPRLPRFGSDSED